jgi:hypothetical protein
MTGYGTQAPLISHHSYAALLKVRAGAGTSIKIMLQIHDGIWNTGAPYHNHAALLKVRCWVMLDLHDYVNC